MAGVDPVTARAGLRTAREIISGRQISYPVPYILGILCAFSVACLIIAFFAADSVRVVALAAGLLALITAVAVTMFAIFVRPELLRSEHHEQVMRLIELVGDKETSPDLRDSVSQTLRALAEPKTRARDAHDNEEHGDER